jgi:hypothetical protein
MAFVVNDPAYRKPQEQGARRQAQGAGRRHRAASAFSTAATGNVPFAVEP